MDQPTIIESDVRRIWGAVRFVDAASARTIEGPLALSAPGARWQRNHAHLHVLMQLDQPAERQTEFDAYEAAFDVLPAVGPTVVSASVSDPAGRYLPRRFEVALPRDVDPAGPTAPRFNPLDVILDAAPAAPLLPTWAVLRVSVFRNGQPAANAVLRLQPAGGGALLGRGLSDARGEALVIAAGIAQMSVGAGDIVVTREVPAELVVSFDPAAPADLPVNPDALAVRADVIRHTVALDLASGRTDTLRIALP
ncbi:hypothetical protein [Piscinibacter sakaiensis]|uniref:hypothetical protein n=1 Tax=Piscinibacter sakaiensis TaxID=1547922 RepID=UPI003AAB1516